MATAPQRASLQAYEVAPRFENNQLKIDVTERDVSSDGSMVVIGSCPQLLLDRVEADLKAARARGDVHPIVAVDAPKRALQAIINEGTHESVGGAIQQGWATQGGFEIVASMAPITPRPPSARNAGLFVLGFDIFDVQNIGNYQVSMGGR